MGITLNLRQDLPVFHGPDQAVVTAISTGILEGDDGPNGSGNPTNQRNLQDQANDARKDPSPQQERKKRKEDGYECHIR
jgi:hypothetical protein